MSEEFFLRATETEIEKALKLCQGNWPSSVIEIPLGKAIGLLERLRALEDRREKEAQKEDSENK